MQRDAFDRRVIVTCNYEADRGGGDGDRLAHNPDDLALTYRTICSLMPVLESNAAPRPDGMGPHTRPLY